MTDTIIGAGLNAAPPAFGYHRAMAGLSKNVPVPTRLVVHQRSRLLEVEFDEGSVFRLPFEYLRVYSPSAEVRGHGPGQETLQLGKRQVGLNALDPVGHYAVQPHFDDGHATGIYSWDYLYWLGQGHAQLWQDYLDRLAAAGGSRDAPGAQAPDVEPSAGGRPPAATATPHDAIAPDTSGASFAPRTVARPR